MHRMRHIVALLGLPLAVCALIDRPADADLIRPSAPRTYPEITADFDGGITYTYNPTSQSGMLHLSNVPLMLSAGPTVADEVTIGPNADGVRSQVLDVALDANGTLRNDPANTYELRGTIVAGGQTYTGLLLKGVPTSFGAQPRDPLNARATDTFDLGVKITGGQLAAAFGPDAYMQVVPRCDSTFLGTFQHDFSGTHPSSTVQAEHAPYPFPIPEPTTLALVLAGGCGLAMRGRLRGR